MLAHPHCDPNELRKINGVEYDSYASAAEFCYRNHRHPDDYYGAPNAEERRLDLNEFKEEFHEPDLLEEDWLELARQLPDCPPRQEVIDLLGRRHIDIQYDWTPTSAATLTQESFKGNPDIPDFIVRYLETLKERWGYRSSDILPYRFQLCLAYPVFSLRIRKSAAVSQQSDRMGVQVPPKTPLRQGILDRIFRPFVC